MKKSEKVFTPEKVQSGAKDMAEEMIKKIEESGKSTLEEMRNEAYRGKTKTTSDPRHGVPITTLREKDPYKKHTKSVHSRSGTEIEVNK